MSVADLLVGKRVCVCAGAGGVGKTTVSAAVALGMAALGGKVAVVTIDPARRLANALGLDQLHNEPARIEPQRFERAGLRLGGELWAMTLDPKRTFDELIDHLARDPVRAAEIKANRVYRELSTAVSGSQEFTAIAKLDELEQGGEYDLLVLDTPPSRNALDFLDAPVRLSAFLEGRGVRAFMRPTGAGMRVIGRGATPLLAALRRVTGVDLLADLSTFFTLLGDMTADFSLRARRVEQMLRAPSTAFLLITSPQHEAIEETIWFRRTLERSAMPFAGVVVNRVHHDALGDRDAGDVERSLRRTLPSELAARVAANFHDYHALARRDARSLDRLARECSDGGLIAIPQLDDDIHDIGGLLAIHRYLFASASERERLIADVVA